MLWAIGLLGADGVPLELAKFRDHYLGASGSAATSPNWNAKWRKWCRVSVDPRQLRLRLLTTVGGSAVATKPVQIASVATERIAPPAPAKRDPPPPEPTPEDRQRIAARWKELRRDLATGADLPRAEERGPRKVAPHISRVLADLAERMAERTASG